MARTLICIVVAAAALGSQRIVSDAFVATPCRPGLSCAYDSVPSSVLFLGVKNNKQADLLRKMELAKQQNNPKTTEAAPPSDQEIKEKNDRLRFEELLKRNSAAVLNDYSADGYLNKQQEEEEITAARSGVDRLFEGDRAPTDCFEELVSIKSENALCKKGAAKLVPWLRKSYDGKRQADYLIILSDPREKSTELHQTIQTLVAEIPSGDIWNNMIVVNADSPAENRRWLKKNDLVDRVDIYSDEKLEWMRSYTALGDNRWSMTMFIIGDGRVQRLARDLDQYGASRAIRNAVKSLNEKRV